MNYCNGLPTPTRVETLLGTYENGTKANIYLKISYYSIIGIMLYLASNTSPDISFAIHHCARFTLNQKKSYYIVVNSICRYILKVLGINIWCSIYAKYWWCIVMRKNILRDYGDMIILKIPFMIIVGLYLW